MRNHKDDRTSWNYAKGPHNQEAKGDDCFTAFQNMCQSIRTSLTLGYKCKGKWKNSKTNIYLVHSHFKHLKHGQWVCLIFLYKTYQKQFEQCLPLCRITHCTERTSFLCLGELYSFLGLHQLPTFYALNFRCHEISLRIPWMWGFFANITSSGTPLSFSSQPLASFVSISHLPWLVTSRMSRVSRTSVVATFPQSVMFSYNFIYIWV